ncbi:MAG: ribosomal protein S18-alanine N-acetyltransferase [Clostridia bacterium]|nr:ribosomal protein S18-alanine N-acetyltransferase [Clostridia bacterium]
MGIRFTPMGWEHIDEILAIEAVSFPTPWSRQSFLHELSDNDLACYVVALDGDKVAGYAGMWIIIDEAHLTNVAVHPDYRGRGIGARLLEELLERAVKLGAERMTLEVRVSNQAARHLYTRMGFRPMGLRKGYYTDTREDAVIMWKENIGTSAG